MEIRVWEGRKNQVIQVVIQVTFQRELQGGSSLIPYLVISLVAVSYSWQYVYSRWMSFEMDASTIEKCNVRDSHYRHTDPSFCNVMSPRNWAHYFVPLGFHFFSKRALELLWHFLRTLIFMNFTTLPSLFPIFPGASAYQWFQTFGKYTW